MAELMPTRLPLASISAPPGVAGIDRGVGLDEVLEGVDAQVERPSADTIPIVTVCPTPKVADGQHDVADMQLVGMAGR